jgi:hypothetical protein
MDRLEKKTGPRRAVPKNLQQRYGIDPAGEPDGEALAAQIDRTEKSPDLGDELTARPFP